MQLFNVICHKGSQHLSLREGEKEEDKDFESEQDNIFNHYLYKFTLNSITKQRYLVLVTTELHFIFDTLSRTQAFARYLLLGVWGTEALPPEARKSHHSEIFNFFVYCCILIKIWFNCRVEVGPSELTDGGSSCLY